MPVIQRGLIRDREANYNVVDIPQHVVEVSKNVFEVSGGGNVKFVGMIRGVFSEMQQLFPEERPVITYIGPSVEAVTDGLELDEWIYYISETVIEEGTSNARNTRRNPTPHHAA